MSNHLRVVAVAFVLAAHCNTLGVFAISGQAAEGTPAPLLGTALCQISIPASPGAATPAAQAAASPVVAVPFDVLFLDLMIRQQDGIHAVSALAGAGAEHAELAAMGSSLAADAAADAAQLRDWRARWYGDIPPLTDRAIAQALDRLAREQGLQRGIPGAFEILGTNPDKMVDALCHAAPPYDLALLDALIPEMNAALLLARTALDLGTHQEVRDFSQRLVTEDQPRFDALIAWRTAWFGATPVVAATPSS